MAQFGNQMFARGGVPGLLGGMSGGFQSQRPMMPQAPQLGGGGAAFQLPQQQAGATAPVGFTPPQSMQPTNLPPGFDLQALMQKFGQAGAPQGMTPPPVGTKQPALGMTQGMTQGMTPPPVGTKQPALGMTQGMTQGMTPPPVGTMQPPMSGGLSPEMLQRLQSFNAAAAGLQRPPGNYGLPQRSAVPSAPVGYGRTPMRSV